MRTCLTLTVDSSRGRHLVGRHAAYRGRCQVHLRPAPRQRGAYGHRRDSQRACRCSPAWKRQTTLTVVLTFNEVYTLALYDFAEQMIVPKHIWEAVEDPVTFLNEEPVGTGPFTEIGIFEAQYWELHKNPNYWQEGKPYHRRVPLPVLSQATMPRIWRRSTVKSTGRQTSSRYREHLCRQESRSTSTTGSRIGGDSASLVAEHHCRRHSTMSRFARRSAWRSTAPQIVAVAMYDYTPPADSSGLTGAIPVSRQMTPPPRAPGSCGTSMPQMPRSMRLDSRWMAMCALVRTDRWSTS